jgi:hypothetical protein
MGGTSRLEALHFELSASHPLIGGFGWVVLLEPLLMPFRKTYFARAIDVSNLASSSQRVFFAGSISRW